MTSKTIRLAFLLGLFLLCVGIIFSAINMRQSTLPFLNQQKENLISKNKKISNKVLSEKLRAISSDEVFTSKFLPSKNECYLGAVVPYTGPNIINAQLRSFELNANKEVSALMIFQYWKGGNNYFNTSLAQELLVRGKIMIISWNPSESVTVGIDQPKYRLSNIIRGDYDDYIKRWAKDIKDWGGPILLRFASEMNGNWLPWGTRFNRTEEYVAAYRHVVDIFKKENVTNVAWIWSPNGIRAAGQADSFYPGDDYVDWVGISGFNWGGLRSYQRWRSFEEVFGPSLNDFRKYKKPILLAELGSVESPNDPMAKAAWITDMFAMVKSQYPEIGMIIWNNNTSFDDEFDWRIETSILAQGAFQKGAKDDYFKSTIRANTENFKTGGVLE